MNDTRSHDHPSPEMPNFIPSPIVAIASVLPFFLTLVILFLCIYLKPNCLKTRRRNEDEEEPGEEMLREDSVVMHDVGFPEDAYLPAQGNPQPKPAPSPSIFHSDLLQEVMSVADVFSPTLSILNRNYNPESESTRESLSNLLTLEKYHEAVRRGLDFQKLNAQEESFVRTYQSIDLHSKDSNELEYLDIDGNPSCPLVESNDEDTEELLQSIMNMCEDKIKDDISVTDLAMPTSDKCKWRSTPVLDLEVGARIPGLVDGDEDAEDLGAMEDGGLQDSCSYSPVYKIGFHGSFDTSFSRSSVYQLSSSQKEQSS